VQLIAQCSIAIKIRPRAFRSNRPAIFILAGTTRLSNFRRSTSGRLEVEEKSREKADFDREVGDEAQKSRDFGPRVEETRHSHIERESRALSDRREIVGES
jgi:hypothetical protein